MVAKACRTIRIGLSKTKSKGLTPEQMKHSKKDTEAKKKEVSIVPTHQAIVSEVQTKTNGSSKGRTKSRPSGESRDEISDTPGGVKSVVKGDTPTFEEISKACHGHPLLFAAAVVSCIASDAYESVEDSLDDVERKKLGPSEVLSDAMIGLFDINKDAQLALQPYMEGQKQFDGTTSLFTCAYLLNDVANMDDLLNVLERDSMVASFDVPKIVSYAEELKSDPQNESGEEIDSSESP